MNRISARKAIALAISAALTIPIGASAQDDGATDKLDQVTVTARKREESLQEVPVAITAFTGEQLKIAGITSTRDLFEATPGLNFDTGFDGNAATPAIRGVVSTEIASFRQKVTTFLDGMPMLGQQGNVPFNAIQQVEVLRGPQSAAFGRSTFGGAINYTTRDPGEAFESEVNLDIGSNGRLNIEALVAGPISDKAGFLISAGSNQIDGESDWKTVEEGISLGGLDSKNVLAKLVLTPTDSVSLEFRYKWLDVDDEQTPRVFLPPDHPIRMLHPDSVATACGAFLDNGPPPQPSCAFVGTFGAVDEVFDYDYASTGVDEGFTRNKRDRFEAEGIFDLDNGASIDVLGFVSDEDFSREADFNLTNDAFGYESNIGFIDEAYGEIRYTSPGEDRFRYGVGLSYYDYEFSSDIYRARALFDAGIPSQRFSEAATNTGLFFNLTYDISDHTTLSVEARLQNDDVSGTNPQPDGTVYEIGQETEAFLPRISLTYSPTDATTFYVQIAKGNNPAGVNVGAVNPAVTYASESFPDIFDAQAIAFFDEEEILSYEAGIKGRLGDRGTYAANVYMLDWENYTQPFNLNFEPADFVDADDDNIGDVGTIYEGMQFSVGRSFLGAGDVSGQGIELEGTYLLTDNLKLGLVASYIDITYDDNACSTSPLDQAVPPNATTAIGLPCVSVAGNEIGTQPKFTGAINLQYVKELSNGMEWFTRWNTRWNSSQYVSEMNLAKLDAFSISDLRMGLSRDSWRAELYATNLFDEDSPQGPSYFFDGRITDPAGVPAPPPFARSIFYTVRRGTQYGLRLSYRFGD